MINEAQESVRVSGEEVIDPEMFKYIVKENGEPNNSIDQYNV